MGVFSIVLRNISRRRVRALIIVMIIMVVCGAFVSIVSVQRGIRTTDVGQEASTKLPLHIRLSDSRYVTAGVYSDPQNVDYAVIDSVVVNDIKKTWGTSVVFDPRITSQNILIRTNTTGAAHKFNDTDISFVLEGIDPYEYSVYIASLESGTAVSFLGITLVNGTWFSEDRRSSDEPQRRVIISKTLADLENITVNDTIALFYDMSYASIYNLRTHPSISLNQTYVSSSTDLNRTGYNVTVCGIFSGGNFRYIYTDLSSAAEMLDRTTFRGWYYNSISIRIAQPKYLADASLDIQSIADKNNLDYVNRLEATGAIQSYTDVTGIQVAFITLIVAFLVIFNSIQMSVHERIKELGTIRSLGAETTTAIAITVFEGLILGIIGGFLGYFFSMSLALISSQVPFLAGALEFATIRGGWYLAVSTLLGGALASAAALIPALVTTMVPPEITLKQK